MYKDYNSLIKNPLLFVEFRLNKYTFVLTLYNTIVAPRMRKSMKEFKILSFSFTRDSRWENLFSGFCRIELFDEFTEGFSLVRGCLPLIANQCTMRMRDITKFFSIQKTSLLITVNIYIKRYFYLISYDLIK